MNSPDSSSTKTTTKRRVIQLAALFLSAAAIYSLYWVMSDHASKEFTRKKQASPQFNFYRQPGEFINRQGKKIRLEQLAGRPSLITFVYKDCASFCPRIMADVFQLRGKLKAYQDRIHYTIIFFDDIKGNFKEIESYHRKYRLEGNSWQVLATDSATLKKLADRFRLKYEILQGKTIDYMHTNMIALTDINGDILLADYGLNEEAINMMVRKVKDL